MGAAGQTAEVVGGGGAVARLGEDLAVEIEHLVGADHQRARMAGRDLQRLGAGQLGRERGGIAAPARLYRVLVDPRRIHLEHEARLFQHGAPRGAARAQHQTHGHEARSPSRRW